MPKTSPKYVVLWKHPRKGDPDPQNGGKAYTHDEWTVSEISCSKAVALKTRKEILTPADDVADRIWDSRPEDVLILPLSAALPFP